MKKIFYAVFSFILLLPYTLQAAADPGAKLDKAVQGTPLADKGSLNPFIGSLIISLLGFLGVLFVILIIYAGYLRMTAGGEADKIKKSNQMMIAATTGLLIILAAYGITSYLLTNLLGVGSPSE